MTVSAHIVFKGIEASPALEAFVQTWTNKLVHLHDGILGCEVLIEQPHRHQQKGRTYHVRIQLHLADRPELVVSHDPGTPGEHDDPYLSVRDAFLAARRQLQDMVARRRDARAS